MLQWIIHLDILIRKLWNGLFGENKQENSDLCHKSFLTRQNLNTHISTSTLKEFTAKKKTMNEQKTKWNMHLGYGG